MVSRTSPLVNAFFIREIIYSIEMLHKHAHNQWQMGGESIAKLRLHKGQSRKKQLSFFNLQFVPKHKNKWQHCIKTLQTIIEKKLKRKQNLHVH
jgi:hypothetical protein